MKLVTTTLLIFLAACCTNLRAQSTLFITPFPAAETCEPNTVLLEAILIPTGTWTYEWHQYQGGCLTVSGFPVVAGTGSSVILDATSESGIYFCVATDHSTGNTIQSNAIAVRILPALFSQQQLPPPFSFGGSTCVSSATLCIPNTINDFYNPPPVVKWYKDYVEIPGATGITYDATVTGNYNYRILGACDATSSSIYVSIASPQVSQITAGSATSFCQGGSVLLSANTGTGFTYQWRKNYTDIVGATSSTYSATSTGIYHCYVGSNSCQPVASNSISVNVNSSPSVNFTLATTYSVSSPPVTLTGSPLGGTFSGPGISGNTFSPSVAGAGTHSITYSYTDANGCTGIRTRTTTVCAPPAAPAGITGTATPCANSFNVTYSCTPVTGAVNYTWTLPPGGTFVSGQNSNSIVVNFGATFNGGTISVVATNSCGTGSAATKSVYGIPAVPAAITGQSTEVCAGSTNKIYTATLSPGATTYTWTATGTISIVSGQGTNQITANFSSNFTTGTLNVMAGNACGSSGLKNLVIFSKPVTPGTINGPATFCANQQGVVYSIAPVTNATTYNWLLPPGAVITSGQGTTSITVNFGNKSGNIKVAAGNACGFSSFKSKKVTKGTCRLAYSPEPDSEISVYPNPSNGTFTIKSNSTAESPAELKIFDLTGKLVLSEKMDQPEMLISHPGLKAGSYMAVIITGNEIKRIPIVVSY